MRNLQEAQNYSQVQSQGLVCVHCGDLWCRGPSPVCDRLSHPVVQLEARSYLTYNVEQPVVLVEPRRDR